MPIGFNHKFPNHGPRGLRTESGRLAPKTEAVPPVPDAERREPGTPETPTPPVDVVAPEATPTPPAAETVPPPGAHEVASSPDSHSEAPPTGGEAPPAHPPSHGPTPPGGSGPSTPRAVTHGRGTRPHKEHKHGHGFNPFTFIIGGIIGFLTAVAVGAWEAVYTGKDVVGNAAGMKGGGHASKPKAHSPGGDHGGGHGH